MILIAIEVLYDVRIYDFSVLNPVGFQIIAMCQFGLLYFPKSTPLHTWLTKMQSKLGLVTLVTKQCD